METFQSTWTRSELVNKAIMRSWCGVQAPKLNILYIDIIANLYPLQLNSYSSTTVNQDYIIIII